MALVTGGASGVGNGVVRALAQNGAVVLIADINEEDGELAANTFRTGGLAVYSPRTDVTDWQSQLAAFKIAVGLSPSKTLDIVVSCAGVTGPSFFLPRAYFSSNIGIRRPAFAFNAAP
ncbi:hypothetical protein D0864_10377 [Hortaea werneckii]|uniref:Uncharacterized protein n=1 Tax=Hortaea werneckii TaxID=91943 RepID=A0A3M7E7T6_HORWE|nr:hypothetical protein D0864_10377 [Hortaea werneckii]